MDGYSDHQAELGETMLQLEMEFEGGLDVKRLAKAVDLTLDAEPVLGCRFADNRYKACFERLEPGRRSAFRLTNSILRTRVLGPRR